MQRAVGGVVICCQDEKKKEKEKEKEKGSYHLSTPNQIASLKKGDDFLDGSSDSLHPFDFILMDIQMPVMGELCQVPAINLLPSLSDSTLSHASSA